MTVVTVKQARENNIPGKWLRSIATWHDRAIAKARNQRDRKRHATIATALRDVAEQLRGDN